jgi:molecular chaperone GrpE
MKNPYSSSSKDAHAACAWTEPEDTVTLSSAGAAAAAGFPPRESAGPEQTPPDAYLPENLEALCREYICPACPTRISLEDQRLRNLAEADNLKKRMQREQEEREKYAGEAILSDLLPALDSLDLAIRYAGPEADSGMMQGVSMTRKLLLDALKPHGLIPAGEEGEAFDPQVHEAVGEETRADMPPLHIAVLMQRGYLLKERLLRPAKVMVSRR